MKATWEDTDPVRVETRGLIVQHLGHHWKDLGFFPGRWEPWKFLSRGEHAHLGSVCRKWTARGKEGRGQPEMR